MLHSLFSEIEVAAIAGSSKAIESCLDRDGETDLFQLHERMPGLEPIAPVWSGVGAE